MIYCEACKKIGKSGSYRTRAEHDSQRVPWIETHQPVEVDDSGAMTAGWCVFCPHCGHTSIDLDTLAPQQVAGETRMRTDKVRHTVIATTPEGDQLIRCGGCQKPYTFNPRWQFQTKRPVSVETGQTLFLVKVPSPGYHPLEEWEAYRTREDGETALAIVQKQLLEEAGYVEFSPGSWAEPGSRDNLEVMDLSAAVEHANSYGDGCDGPYEEYIQTTLFTAVVRG